MALRNVPASPENHYGLTPTRSRRLILLAALLVGSCATLWSTYRFHFHESPTTQETFNRPLADKIADLESPTNRFVLTTINRLHIVPRPFLWGFADIIRQGVESSGFPLYFRDHIYIEKKPPSTTSRINYSSKSPSDSCSSLPLASSFSSREKLRWKTAQNSGSSFFSFSSSSQQSPHRIPNTPAFATLFLFTRRSPCLPAQHSHSSCSKNPPLGKRLAMVTATWAVASAVPVLRPWEYHNAFGGGTSHAYLHSSNEGIDLGLRVKDFASYYHRVLEPNGEFPYLINYLTSNEELRARGIHTMNDKWDSGELPDDSNVIHGTLGSSKRSWPTLLQHGLGSFQQTEPTERVGNLLIFRGSSICPNGAPSASSTGAVSPALYARPQRRALPKLYPSSNRAADANPHFYPAWIEIGNLQAQLGNREVAIHAFEQALANAPNVPIFRNVLIDELLQLQTSPDIRQLRPIRDPFAE